MNPSPLTLSYNPAVPTHTPICPKCGYDQSGEVATWSTQCPTQGTCPECGLTFTWANVLNPSRIQLPWYVEHAPKLTATIKRTPPTILRLILPPIFWHRIPITATIALSMLIRWSLVLIVLAHLSSSVAMGLGRWRAYDEYRYEFINPSKQLALLDYMSLTSNAFFAPLVTIYPSANGTLQFNWYSHRHEFTSDYLVIASFPFGASLLWLIVLAVMPTTRRIAKLRTEHVFRAAIIAATSCALLFEFGRTVQGLIMFRQPFLDWYAPVLGFCVFLTAIWHFLFWPAAIIIGWKIRPAILLVTLGTIAAFLGAFTLTVIIGLIR